MRARVRAAVAELTQATHRDVSAAAARARLEPLALELHAWQRVQSPVVDALSGAATATRLEEIPAVPVQLYKELEIATFPVAEARVVFRTSGTTQGTRGTVYLRDTSLYDLGARAHAHACISDLPRRVVSLCSHAEDSSLGHMVADFAGHTQVRCFDPTHGVSPDTWAELRATDEPCFVACTAFALDALFEQPGSAALDPRSVVMVTGGFKGRHTRLDAPGLYRALADRLGSPRVVGEYGMTELSSQLWTEPVAAGQVPGAFRAPAWMHVYAVDPVTGQPVEGEGLLRFVDLCNVDSSLAIETLDLGVVRFHDGAQWVELRGRLAGSEARGCSLTVEELRFLGREGAGRPLP